MNVRWPLTILSVLVAMRCSVALADPSQPIAAAESAAAEALTRFRVVQEDPESRCAERIDSVQSAMGVVFGKAPLPGNPRALEKRLETLGIQEAGTTIFCIPESGEVNFYKDDLDAVAADVPSRDFLWERATRVLGSLASTGLVDFAQLDLSSVKWMQMKSGEDDLQSGFSTMRVEGTRVGIRRKLNDLPFFGNGVVIDFDNNGHPRRVSVSWRKLELNPEAVGPKLDRQTADELFEQHSRHIRGDSPAERTRVSIGYADEGMRASQHVAEPFFFYNYYVGKRQHELKVPATVNRGAPVTNGVLLKATPSRRGSPRAATSAPTSPRSE